MTLYQGEGGVCLSVALSELVQELPAWKIAFIRQSVEHGDFKKGELTPFFKKVASEFEVPLGTVQNFHYNVLQKNKIPNLGLIVKSFTDTDSTASKLSPADNADRSDDAGKAEIVAKPEVVAEVLTQEKKEPTELTPEELGRLIAIDPDAFVVKDGDYKVGRVVEVKVVDVRDYGAIVETTDGYYTRGLIHITKIRQGEYVRDVRKFLAFGDTVRALILEFEEQQNRLKLSTQAFPLEAKNYFKATNAATQPSSSIPVATAVKLPEQSPEPINPVAEKLSAVKDQIVTVSQPVKPAAVATPKITNGESVEVGASVSHLVTGDERDQVKLYLNGVVGALTPKAEELMLGIIKKHGMFKFTMGMMQAVSGFQPDLGVILLKEIDSKLGERL